MSVVSFRLYEACWIYRNWRSVKERDRLDIKPFWRGVIGVFFCHSLLRRIHEDEAARAIEAPSFSPAGLAAAWVALVICGNLLTRFGGLGTSIVSAFIPSFLCLVPVQNYVNTVTGPGGANLAWYRWSAGHVVCLVIGIVVWVRLRIGLRAG